MPRTSDADLDELVRQSTTPLLNRPLYLWDLDSTVCSTVHRRHMVDDIREGKSTWDDYAMQCSKDAPIHGSVALMHELRGPHVAVSGRSALAFDLTMRWFQINHVPMHAVILRPAGDHTPNGLWKVRVVKSLQRQGGDVRLFFEDWDEVAAQITAQTGVPVVGINPFDPKEASRSQGAV